MPQKIQNDASFFWPRSHRQVSLIHYGLGFMLVCLFCKDLFSQRWLIYQDQVMVFRQYVNLRDTLGIDFYWALVGTQLFLLSLFFRGIKVGLVSALLSLTILLDCMESFANHRLLIVIVLALYSLKPVNFERLKTRPDEVASYWNLDLIRLHASIVYITTVAHKLNAQFLSGDTIHELMVMLHHHEMRSYPQWLMSLIENSTFCKVMAWTTLLLEVGIALLIHLPGKVKWAFVMALLLHGAFAILMPNVWMFSLIMMVVLMSAIPHDSQNPLFNRFESEQA